MRKVICTLLIIICFTLQCTVFKSFSLGGIVPNLMIILTSSFGFMRGEEDGLIIGFFCGLLCDIFSGNVLGLYALILMVIGYINGKFCRIFYPEDIKLPLALILISDLTYSIVCYILTFLVRGRFAFSYYLYHVIMPEVLYTMIALVIFYPLFLLINVKLEGREKRRMQKFV